jgi:hypothetical protein
MLQCRKCGGPHITIKCGKIEEPKKQVIEQKQKSNYRKNKVYTIKINNLPEDMSENEMQELTYDWGHIKNIKIIKYNKISVAYVDFEYLEEAEYFVKALDKTPFEYMILEVKIV